MKMKLKNKLPPLFQGYFYLNLIRQICVSINFVNNELVIHWQNSH